MMFSLADEIRRLWEAAFRRSACSAIMNRSEGRAPRVRNRWIAFRRPPHERFRKYFVGSSRRAGEVGHRLRRRLALRLGEIDGSLPGVPGYRSLSSGAAGASNSDCYD